MGPRARKIIGAGVLIAALGVATAWNLFQPKSHPYGTWENLGQPDLANGENLFWAGGCASCHAAPGAEGEALKVLAGGRTLKTEFGTFHVPNISSDPDYGMGSWTLAQFGNAMTRGVGRKGEHLYPSFPYGSYARMPAKDVNDLYGYLKTLPASNAVAPPHDLKSPYDIRLAVGGWKLLYFDDKPRVTLANADEKVKRGQYLVEGPGHCGECHTPRDAMGGFLRGQWLAGGPNPEGEGTIPDIRPGSKAIGEWSESDIVNYFETGFTPEFDSAGGSMVEVQQNLSRLPKSDLEAIAAYLKAIPAAN